MMIHQAEFIGSSVDYRKCPDVKNPEYAFIGRSNVGKSSLINMLTNRKKLAKISGTPGKTQLINHFLINDKWFLVDLPGYGWAKASKTKKEDWEKMSRDYLLYRSNLVCVFILIDSRLPPQKVDLEFIHWAGENQIPFALIFTKSDKQSKGKTSKSVAAFMKKLKETWAELPPVIVSSAVNGAGKEEIIGFIERINQGKVG